MAGGSTVLAAVITCPPWLLDTGLGSATAITVGPLIVAAGFTETCEAGSDDGRDAQPTAKANPSALPQVRQFSQDILAVRVCIGWARLAIIFQGEELSYIPQGAGSWR